MLVEAQNVFHCRPRVQGRSPRLPELPGTQGAFQLRRANSSRPRPHTLLRMLPLGARPATGATLGRRAHAATALAVPSFSYPPAGGAPTPHARASGFATIGALANAAHDRR